MDQKPVDRDDIKRFVKFAESADLATCGNVDALKQMAEGLATTLNVFENQIRKDLSKWRRIDAAYTAIRERGNTVVREADRVKRARASNSQARR